MSWKRYTPEQIINMLLQTELEFSQGAEGRAGKLYLVANSPNNQDCK